MPNPRMRGKRGYQNMKVPIKMLWTSREMVEVMVA
jgi:hypothetical protein